MNVRHIGRITGEEINRGALHGKRESGRSVESVYANLRVDDI